MSYGSKWQRRLLIIAQSEPSMEKLMNLQTQAGISAPGLDTHSIASMAKATLERTSALMITPGAAAMVRQLLASLGELGPYDNYKFFPAAALAVTEKVERDHGIQERRRFLRMCIAQAVLDTVDSDRFKSLPARVAAQQSAQLLRIAADTDESAEWLDTQHDLLHKELGLATMRLYAAAAQVVDFRCGIPRSIIVKAGLRGILPNLRNIARLGGFRPYFQVHTHDFMLDNFNEAGWNECYRCCAELYALHPDVLGMFGASWFYHPVLDTISPRLSYLRDVPLKGGAHLFFVEEGGAARANSLATSPTRRKLYEEGKYFPTTYMMVWGREAQSNWARQF
jgi:hypothetical protein